MLFKSSPRLPSTRPSPPSSTARRRRPALPYGTAAIAQNAAEEAEARAASLAPITKRVLDEIDARRRSSTSSASSSSSTAGEPRQQEQAGGAGGATTWGALLRADAAWARVKEAAARSRGRGGRAAAPPSPPPPEFISLRRSETAAAVAAAAASSSSSSSSPSQPPLEAFDVAVAGGTLGVLLAASLSSAGLRVAVVEAGPLRGRDQEWNICREELEALVAAGALSAADAAGAVVGEFNPVRCAFGMEVGKPPAASVITTDVLNLGVSPDKLINGARRALEGASRPGRVFERWPLATVALCGDGVVLARRTLHGGAGGGGGGEGGGERGGEAAAPETITARLFVDCMGSGSPAARQARGPGATPDGVCMVAGTCARGPWPAPGGPGPTGGGGGGPPPPPPFAADVIAAVDGAALREGVSVPGQFFWESFPAAAGEGEEEGAEGGAGDGEGAEDEGGASTRTTYMFQYSDLARPDLRPSLVEFVEEYWRRVRGYQGLDAAAPAGEGEGEGGEEGAGGGGGGSGPGGLAVESPPFFVERVLFGVFYTFRDSPLRPPPTWDRYLPAGDAAGLQSPLSFGGLGSLSRHAARVRRAVADALACDAISAADLALINSCYSPGLSGAWMLQRAMAARPERPPPYPGLVPDLLAANFVAMQALGDRTLRPFLRDVVRFDGLSLTLARQVAARPDLVPAIVAHVGVAALLDWLRHFVALGAFAALATAARPLAPLVDGAGFLSPKAKFRARRRLEAWEYGSGLDWVYDEEKYGKRE